MSPAPVSNPTPIPLSPLLPRQFVVAVAVLLLGFAWPLASLAWFAVNSSLFSHILLIPFVSGWLLWTVRRSLVAEPPHCRYWSLLPLLVGLTVLSWFGFAQLTNAGWSDTSRLAATTIAFVCLLAGVALFYLGSRTLRLLAFPIGFLVFMVPFPPAVEASIEAFLQHGSALAAHALFTLTGTTFNSDGLTFHLANISLQVAPECSGIHSSLVLFVVSVLAGHLFLKSTGKRAALTLAVIPLALLRNGCRIVTIGLLCVHIGPEMIFSWIHRHGGPVFFILSLIPFFFLLFALIRLDHRRPSQSLPQPPV
jgi:exosortase C (VPDSG-CTERM-specific)